MRYALVVCLATAWALSCAAEESPRVIEEKRGNFTNLSVEGQLAATKPVGCVVLENLDNSYTPADLYKGVQACVLAENYDLAVNLFALAGAYGAFDSERVADRSAAQGKTVLIMTTFAAFDAQRKKAFSDRLSSINQDPTLHRELCSKISKLGAPNYFPRYMILHGMKAFQGDPYTHALIENFNAAETWAKVQTNYLQCQAS